MCVDVLSQSPVMLAANEVAEDLRTSRKVVYEMVQQGQIPDWASSTGGGNDAPTVSRRGPGEAPVGDRSSPATATEAEYLTIRQAAELLQVHEKTAYEWALKRKLPGAFRLPAGPWRVSRTGLLRYVRENRVLAPGESER